MKKAEIHTAKGVMKVEFYEQDAPGTVANFCKLAQDGSQALQARMTDIFAAGCWLEWQLFDAVMR